MAGGSSDILAAAMTAPGILTAGLADADGDLLDGAPGLECELHVSVKAGHVMRTLCSAMGKDLGRGGVRIITVEGRTRHVAIAPASDATTLVIAAVAPTRLGLLRMYTERARTALEASFRAECAPAAQAVNDAPVGRLHVPLAAPAGTNGEVIVLGTHTFRLVRKLAEQLLKIDGVRSSRLRAYSPSSTVIDVGLDDGATFEGIDARRLNEVCVERTESGGTRLVLRVERTAAGSESAR